MMIAGVFLYRYVSEMSKFKTPNSIFWLKYHTFKVNILRDFLSISKSVL